MFKVVRDPTFLHDVTVMTPIDGGHREESVKVRYRLMDVAVSEAVDFSDQVQAAAFLERAVVSFSDLVDDADQPIACTEAMRDLLLQRPNIHLACIAGYFAAVTKARAGN